MTRFARAAIVAIAAAAVTEAGVALAVARGNPATWRGAVEVHDLRALPPSGDRYAGAVDGLWIGDVRYPMSAYGTIALPRAAATVMHGWALDATTKRPFIAAFISVDGGAYVPVPYSASRPDVASALRCDCANSGYGIRFDPEELDAGRHSIALAFVTQARAVVRGPQVDVTVR